MHDVARVEQVEPSLEDVFLDVVEKAAVMRKALAVGRKEFRQILRDRRTLMILLFIPAFFLLLFGYALNFDIRTSRSPSRTATTRRESRRARLGVRELRLLRPGRVGRLRTPRSSDLMDRNAIRAALVIPEGLGRDLQRGRPTPVQVLINGDNANTATTVMGYALTIVASESAAVPARRRARRRAAAAGAARAARLVQPASCAARCSSCPGSSPTSR